MTDTNCDWLHTWALLSPDKIALKDVVQARNFTYRQFYYGANRMAQYLVEMGVQAGDRVAVLSPNRTESVFLLFALQRLAAILVPINSRLSAPEVEFVLQDSQPQFLFYDGEFAELAQGLTHLTRTLPLGHLSSFITDGELAPDSLVDFAGDMASPCLILYTSGTTGSPKGVVLTNKILFWNSINTTLSLNLTSEDVTVNFSPLFHTGGWNVLLTPFIHRGATVVLLPKFDADRVLELLEQERVTVFFGVPTTLALLSESPRFWQTDLSSVRYAIVGGEPMALNRIQTWHAKGVAIRQGFGMTECGPNCFSLSEAMAEAKIGSIGRPNFYVQTRIVDQDNRDVGVGEVGELLLRGPMCMTEYWRNPEATKQSFHEGWLRTGDLVRRDEDHDYYVVGRKKDMYISGGENVYPAEVEKVISRHPEVAEVAVLGIHDSQWGEVGKAFVVAKGNQPPPTEELIAFCQQQLARYKIPKKFAFLEELPKGDSGKILKKQLAQMENQGMNQ